MHVCAAVSLPLSPSPSLSIVLLRLHSLPHSVSFTDPPTAVSAWNTPTTACISSSFYFLYIFLKDESHLLLRFVLTWTDICKQQQQQNRLTFLAIPLSFHQFLNTFRPHPHSGLRADPHETLASLFPSPPPLLFSPLSPGLLPPQRACCLCVSLHLSLFPPS
jgi:hypothetical protein